MPSIAFATIKGGVGKTTLAVHTAAALADAGRQVLLLDLDPQAHASLALGLEPGDRACVADALGPDPTHTLDKVIVPAAKRPNLMVAPACLRMAALERQLFLWGHRLRAIPRALRSLQYEPEIVIIDTPPHIGAFTEAALHYADVVAAPVPTGAFALQGLAEIELAWREVREGAGQLCVVINMWDRRTPATNSAMEVALADVTLPIIAARVPRSEAINQAGLAYDVVFDTRPDANGVEELQALTSELAARAGLGRAPVRKKAG